jgi:hypothetical protein
MIFLGVSWACESRQAEHSDYMYLQCTPPSISVGGTGAALFLLQNLPFPFPMMLRILVSVATYIGILNTIVIIIYYSLFT